MAAAYLVAVLCAGWCSACERFRPDFQGADLAGAADHRLWIDIEEHADALPDTFDPVSLPMLLVASSSAEVVYFGAVRPDVQIVKRLAQVRSAQAGAEELLAAVVAGWLAPEPGPR